MTQEALIQKVTALEKELGQLRQKVQGLEEERSKFNRNWQKLHEALEKMRGAIYFKGCGQL